MAHPRLSTFENPGIPIFGKRKITLNKTSNYTRHMGWISLELCSHSVILQNSDWFGIGCLCYPSIYWAAWNRTDSMVV